MFSNCFDVVGFLFISNELMILLTFSTIILLIIYGVLNEFSKI
jgi:hypothetical protein